MADTSYTEASIAALEKAIADGVQRVRYQDREVVYRSLDEMRATLASMKRGVRGSNKGGGLFGGVRINATHSKGLD